MPFVWLFLGLLALAIIAGILIAILPLILFALSFLLVMFVLTLIGNILFHVIAR